MAFFLSEIEVKPIAKSAGPLWRRLSLRSLKCILVGVLVCHIVVFLMLCQPRYFKLRSLQEDKTHWEEVLRAGVSGTSTIMPTRDQLLDMIEQCRSAFLNQGVDVSSLNVERFGERREAEKGVSIDYALVRFRLLGQWQGIVTSLQELEEMQGVSIHIQEVVLAEEGGETLLQIYFCTGE